MELIIDRVSKQYKNKFAVDQISINLKKGCTWIAGGKWCRKNNPYANDLRHLKTNQRLHFF